MTERPILFSGPMVRAILDGRKTLTRRIVDTGAMGSLLGLDASDPQCWGYVGPDGSHSPLPMKYGVPGDRLWVREMFSPFKGSSERCKIADAVYVVLADGTQVYRSGEMFPGLAKYADGAWSLVKWRPSIHMPRWASRISLDVTSVRIERLQDITEEDARAEGVRPLQMDHGSFLPTFEGTWDSLNAKRAPWESNPWVWVVTFRRVETDDRQRG